MLNIGTPEILLIIFIGIIFRIITVIPYWRIFAKAGYSPALSLLMFIPGVATGMVYFIGFAPWPTKTDPHTIA
jgi:hypothetical protein